MKLVQLLASIRSRRRGPQGDSVFPKGVRVERGRLEAWLRDRPSDLARLSPVFAVAAIVAAAAVVRIVRATAYGGLTGDEGFTLALAQRPFGQMLHLFTFEANGLLYPLVEWLPVRLSSGLVMLRLPALLAGTLAVLALYWTGVRMVGRRAALIAAGLLAITPVAVGFSQLARPYVFAMLFAIVAYGCLDRVELDRRYWAAYVIAMVLLGYSNALAVVTVAAAQIVFVLERRTTLRRWALSIVATAVALVPLEVLLVAEHSKRDALYWLDKPTLHTVVPTATDFFSGRKALVVAVIVVVASVLTKWGRSRRTLSVAAWAIGPPLLVFVISQVSPAFSIDYVLPALPGILLLVSSAAVSLPRIAGVVAVAAIGVLFVQALISGHGRNPYHPQGWRSAGRALVQQRQGDPVVFDIPDGLVAAGFYSSQFRAPNGRLVVSGWRDEPMPPKVSLLDDPGGYGRVPPGPPSAALLSRLVKDTGAVFVMLYETARQGDVMKSPGMLWAARTCHVESSLLGVVRMVRISACV